MLTLLSTISAAIVWAAAHAWVFLLALAPTVLNFLQPILSAIVDGLKGFISFIWTAVKENNSAAWLLTFTLMVLAFGFGYHYGWQQAIDWVHAHYKLISKGLTLSNWWKIW